MGLSRPGDWQFFSPLFSNFQTGPLKNNEVQVVPREPGSSLAAGTSLPCPSHLPSGAANDSQRLEGEAPLGCQAGCRQGLGRPRAPLSCPGQGTRSLHHTPRGRLSSQGPAAGAPRGTTGRTVKTSASLVEQGCLPISSTGKEAGKSAGHLQGASVWEREEFRGGLWRWLRGSEKALSATDVCAQWLSG